MILFCIHTYGDTDRVTALVSANTENVSCAQFQLNVVILPCI